MNEYERMKAQKDEILSRELTLICSDCKATLVYRREGNQVTVMHSCTPKVARQRIKELRKLAWPWIPARQGQITFEEWSKLVSWVTNSELIAEETTK